jgi:hypothetical protein
MKIKDLHSVALIVVLLASFLARLYFFFDYHEVWWDSAVYIEMGKYLFSFGQAGFWEPIRPICWPIFLGLVWFLKLDVFLLGRAAQLLLSLGSIYLLYDIASRVFGKRAAILASSIFSFSSILFFLGFHLYVEIPATFLLLLSIALLLRAKVFWSGIVFALSVLTKFPMLVYSIPLAFLFLAKGFSDKSRVMGLRGILRFAAGAFVPFLPFLVFNLFMYGSTVFPFIEAHRTILQVLGCNVLLFKPWYFYMQMLLLENPLYLLLPLGILAALRNYSKERLFVVVCFLVPFAYFTQLHCRDYRYLVIFLPFASICVSAFLDNETKHLSNKFFYALVISLFCISAVQGVRYYLANEVRSEPDISSSYYRFLEHITPQKEVWVSNPIIGVYTDSRIYQIYYPVYNRFVVKDFNDYVLHHYQNISYVFLDTCGGGIICPPSDAVCVTETQKLLSFLRLKFSLVFNKEYGTCTYYIFESI